ncbi:MAG TPA: hypothetical protein VMV05_04900 [bacterium]|nr:hypothetical protein [bacterium]
MPEYAIKPEKVEAPTATHLSEEMHRRGFAVEMNIKGSPDQWEAIRFSEPGPPEVECFLSYSDKRDALNVSVSVDSPPQAAELQMVLVDLLLSELGGQVDNLKTRERYTAQEFSEKLKHLHGAKPGPKDLVWIVFSWAVVLLAVLILVLKPQTRGLAAMLLLASLASAGGLTYAHFHSK